MAKQNKSNCLSYEMQEGFYVELWEFGGGWKIHIMGERNGWIDKVNIQGRQYFLHITEERSAFHHETLEQAVEAAWLDWGQKMSGVQGASKEWYSSFFAEELTSKIPKVPEKWETDEVPW